MFDCFSKLLRHSRNGLYSSSRFMTGVLTALLFLSVSFVDQDLGHTKPIAKIPKKQWAYSNMLALRYNPLGLQNELFMGYKQKLYNKPESNLLFGKSYWWTGLIARASPQFAMAGLFFKTSPIAVLELQGAFSRVQSLTTAADLPEYFTDGTQAAVNSTSNDRADAGHIITKGWQSSLQARLQAKVGSIAIRTTNLFRYFDLEGDEGALQSDLFYDQTLDLVTPLQGMVYQNDTDLLYTKSSQNWVFGGRYTFTKSFEKDKLDAEVAKQIYDIQRLGFLFAWKFKAPLSEQGLEAKKRHALIVLSQWHLDHAYRNGQEMNRAIPYFAVVYALSGRLGQ